MNNLDKILSTIRFQPILDKYADIEVLVEDILAHDDCCKYCVYSACAGTVCDMHDYANRTTCKNGVLRWLFNDACTRDECDRMLVKGVKDILDIEDCEPKDFYTFTIKMVTNDVDVDGEAFSDNAMMDLLSLCYGEPVVFSEKSRAYIYDAHFITTFERNSLGISHKYIQASCFVEKTSENEALLDWLKNTNQPTVLIACNVPRKIEKQLYYQLDAVDELYEIRFKI